MFLNPFKRISGWVKVTWLSLATHINLTQPNRGQMTDSSTHKATHSDFIHCKWCIKKNCNSCKSHKSHSWLVVAATVVNLTSVRIERDKHSSGLQNWQADVSITGCQFIGHHLVSHCRSSAPSKIKHFVTQRALRTLRKCSGSASCSAALCR